MTIAIKNETPDARSIDLASAVSGLQFPRMQNASPRISRAIWVGISLVLLLVLFAFLLTRLEPRRRAAPPQIGQIASFILTNQAGHTVTLADLQGKVWVADIIFTRCAGPCPRMTRQMASLQAALPADSPARLVTLTTDPEFDTPEVLSKYAARFNADTNRWWFLTGGKNEIASLARDGLKLSGFIETKPEERQTPEDLFIHSTMFVVVDKHAILRGAYETGGDGVSWTNVQSEILQVIRTLEQEE
jgi:protein SCO1/2